MKNRGSTPCFFHFVSVFRAPIPVLESLGRHILQLLEDLAKIALIWESYILRDLRKLPVHYAQS